MSESGAPRRGDQELEHTGELRLRIFAPTRERLFAEAARAVADVLTGEAGFEPGDALVDTVELSAADGDALLVAWLNELLFYAEQRGVVVVSCALTLDERKLRATLRARRPRGWKPPLKPAAYHDLAITAEDGGFEATVVLNV